jgi:hypothetical protein
MDDKQEEPIKDPREGDRLLAGNLPFNTTYDQVVEALSRHSQILDLHASVRPDGKTNRGSAIFRGPSNQTEKLLAATVVLNSRILRLNVRTKTTRPIGPTPFGVPQS